MNLNCVHSSSRSLVVISSRIAMRFMKMCIKHDPNSPKAARGFVKLLKVIEKLDLTFSLSSSFFLIAPPTSSKMVREYPQPLVDSSSYLISMAFLLVVMLQSLLLPFFLLLVSESGEIN